MSLAAALQTANIIEDAYEAGRDIYKSLPPGMRKGIQKASSRVKKRAKRSWDTYKNNQGPNFTFGDPVGSDSTKRWQPVSTANLGRPSRTLLSADLVNIPLGADNEINLRQRGMINCRGISLYMNMRNNQEDAMYCNVAVVCPKFQQNLPGISVADFFRGNGSDRGVDFSSSSLTGLQMHMLPINKDKFHILYHRRITLAPRGPVASDFSIGNAMPNYYTLKKYIKVNRQLRYDGNTIVSGRIQLVYWFSDFDSVASSVPEDNAVTVSEHHLVYFRDTR